MLNINPFKINSNQTSQKAKKVSFLQPSYFTNINFQNTKLAPLKKDTISFTSRYVTEDQQMCQNIHDHAQSAQSYMVNVLARDFGEMVYQKRDENGKRIQTGNEDAPIEIIEARIKSPDSIQEKIDKKIEKAFKPGNSSFLQDIFSPHDEKGIKTHIKDISGTRIVMRNASYENTGRILSTLANTIKEEGLIVDEVQNYSQNSSQKTFGYFKKEDLEKLMEAINEVRSLNELPSIEVQELEKGSGYMALHLDFNLADIGETRPKRGFHSEMQIIGSDVAKLKDIEDFCYKLKAGDKIKSGHTAYTPFQKFFDEAYRDPKRSEDDQKMVEDAFELYTRRAYEKQRNRATNDKKSDYRFPTLEECEVDNVLPSILDFNNLATIKKSCDDLYWIYSVSKAQDAKKAIETTEKEDLV